MHSKNYVMKDFHWGLKICVNSGLLSPMRRDYIWEESGMLPPLLLCTKKSKRTRLCWTEHNLWVKATPNVGTVYATMQYDISVRVPLLFPHISFCLSNLSVCNALLFYSSCRAANSKVEDASELILRKCTLWAGGNGWPSNEILNTWWMHFSFRTQVSVSFPKFLNCLYRSIIALPVCYKRVWKRILTG